MKAKARFAFCFSRSTLAIVLTLGAVLALSAAPASALTVHRFSHTIGSEGEGDGQLRNPVGIAVNRTSHDIYVVDVGNRRVEEFSSAGSFIRAIGADVGGPGIDTCTSNCHPGTVAGRPGAFFLPQFIAIDNSGGPSEGDVYVSDPFSHPAGQSGGTIQKFDSAGNLIASWGNGGELDGSTAPGGPFAGVQGIAVDDSGNLFVASQPGGFGSDPRIVKFNQAGAFVSPEITPDVNPSDNGLSVDSAGHIFVGGAITELQGDGTEIGWVMSHAVSEPDSNGFGLDPENNDLYNLKGGFDASQAIDRYAFPPCNPAPASACSPVETFGVGDLGTGGPKGGIAVDPSLSPGGSTVYAVDNGDNSIQVFSPVVLPDVATGQATEVTPTSATLNGTVNPDGVEVTDCHFDYVTDTAFKAGGYSDLSSGGSAPCESPDAGEIGSGSSEVAVHADLIGLTPAAGYHYRLVAANANDSNPGNDAILAPPSIDSAVAQNITATDADLSVEINPNGFDTKCEFQYGTDTTYSLGSLPCNPEDLGSGNADVSRALHLSSLTANTTYHWRVLATNARGTTTGGDHTFVYDTGALGLPDGRAYEMVTPDYKDGQPVRPVLISSDGNRFIAESGGLFAGGQNLPQCANNVGAYYEFDRTEGGWQATPMSPPASEVTQACMTDIASPDLTKTLWENTASPDFQFDLSTREADGSFADFGPSTPTAGWRMQPVAQPEGVSDDLSHVVWSEGGSPTHETTGLHELYVEPYFPFDPTQQGRSPMEYSGSGNAAPRLVAVSGGAGSTEVISKCGAVIGGYNSLYHGMSADGGTVFFTPQARDSLEGKACSAGEAPAVFRLFARINGSSTVPISDRSEAGCTGPCQASTPSDANFEGASADGSEAFFTSTQQLLDTASEDPTESAAPQVEGSQGCAGTTAAGGCNLYLYDFRRPEGERLIDVSDGGSNPRVQGVTRISDDGSHAYFVAKGVLTAETNAQGQSAENGADNLYVFERDSRYPSGHTAFIADLCSAAVRSGDVVTNACPSTSALNPYGAMRFNGGGAPPNDQSLWSADDYRPAQTTPDGRYLVFVSRGQLTPDTTGQAFQVFVYDSQTGALTRVSHGEHGFNDNGNGPSGGTADAFIAAPRFDHHRIIGLETQAPDWRAMSDDGSYIFFQSPRGLTPKAVDSVAIGTDPDDSFHGTVYAQNVYEFHQGQVSLISDGRDIARAARSGSFDVTNTFSAVSLVGTNASGSDVFFSTADQLTPGDTNTLQDIYDARIGGGFPETHPVPCQTSDACHQSGTTEGSSASPATPAFNGKEEGPANPRCAKGLVKRHGSCVSKRHKHRRHKHAKRRANAHREAER